MRRCNRIFSWRISCLLVQAIFHRGISTQHCGMSLIKGEDCCDKTDRFIQNNKYYCKFILKQRAHIFSCSLYHEALFQSQNLSRFCSHFLYELRGKRNGWRIRITRSAPSQTPPAPRLQQNGPSYSNSKLSFSFISDVTLTSRRSGVLSGHLVALISDKFYSWFDGGCLRGLPSHYMSYLSALARVGLSPLGLVVRCHPRDAPLPGISWNILQMSQRLRMLYGDLINLSAPQWGRGNGAP